jgi:hypothetical protein
MRNLLGRLREMGFVPAEEEIDTDTLTIEMPLVGFSEAALENLDRLIARQGGAENPFEKPLRQQRL